MDMPHLAWHLSGGTTELLYVEPVGHTVKARVIGKTSDISAGQLIDRIGVALGMGFPAGKEMDRLSLRSDKSDSFSVKVNDLTFSLSGMENKIKGMLEKGCAPADAARFTFETLAKVLQRTTELALKEYGDLPVLCSGGVASNSLLRQRLGVFDTIFAPPQYSTDNALGVAILTKRALEWG